MVKCLCDDNLQCFSFVKLVICSCYFCPSYRAAVVASPSPVSPVEQCRCCRAYYTHNTVIEIYETLTGTISGREIHCAR